MSFNAYDLLWLLLPLAAASGWYVARFDQRRQAKRSLDLPSAYFKGLNFLLNEQPDKAIEVFIQVLEVNSDTVETHLALGNLFRRRGEVERAIRVHQNLIARPTLDKDQRTHALLELGQDYLKAGLLDRAESLFLELAEIRAHSEQALRHLLHIYQQEKEGEKGESLKHALDSDENCVRASILLGDIEAAEGRFREAIKAWQRIEDQDDHYLGEVAGRIAENFRRLNDEQGLYDFFSAALQRHGGVALVLAFADVIKERDGAKAAEKFVVDWLRRKPNVHGLHQLLELNAELAQGAARQDLLLLKGIIKKLREQHLGYACQQCGFRGKTLHWLCPGCNRWNTIKPVVEE